MTVTTAAPEDDNVRHNLADEETREIAVTPRPFPNHAFCKKCGCYNRIDARFCQVCGTPFNDRCPGCSE